MLLNGEVTIQVPYLYFERSMSLPQVSAPCSRLPSVPQAQFACHPCDTFSRPPLDGSLCISELYEWHARNSPNHPLFQYLEEDGSAATISYKDATRAMHRGGWLLKAAIEAAQPQSKHPIIAVLSLSGVYRSFLYARL